MLADGRLKHVPAKYRVGQKVRVSFKKHAFSRGYGQRFTDRMFIISAVNTKRIVPTYTLRNEANNDGVSEGVKGTFYESQLTACNIDKYRGTPVGERVKNGRREVLLRWKGYTDDYNTYVPEREIDKIGDNS